MPVIGGEETIRREDVSDFAKTMENRIAYFYLSGNELLHLDTREYDRQIVLPIL
jgi:hypothetical protein